ncbi:MAG: nucleotidyl transferase AbiEii/AbiGii toxin family protein [Ornithinimicrobium sp.]
MLEGLLARLSGSAYVDRLVLKGGVLLAAFGDRRPTRHVDLASIDLNNDATHVLSVVQAVAATAPSIADGLAFEIASAQEDVIRDSNEYSGVRVSMNVTLASARAAFHVDVSVGNPIWPSPQDVAVPRLLDGPDIQVRGYPMEMALAEKLVTAVQRGTAGTRWRDFGDIWTLSHNHTLRGTDVQEAIEQVATHREADLSTLKTALVGYAHLAQAKWAQWRRKLKLDSLPAEFAEVLAACREFSDPALRGEVTGKTWTPSTRTWS